MAKKISPELSVLTEMTDTLKNTLWPKARAARVPIDPVAFFVALISGPVLVTIVFFWVLLIPVAALMLGGPVYLLIGTPLLLIYLARPSATSTGVAVLAFWANAAMCLVVFVALSIARNDDAPAVLGILAFGSIFAPLWGLTTGSIYFRLCRPALTS
jgi:hypothetical protein